MSKIPLPAQAGWRLCATQLPLSLANMICTNVPGPQVPLYLLGHKMLRCYPYVPIGGEMGVNVAILSYDGVAYVGFGGDIHAVPDIDCLEDLFRTSFTDLREASTGKPAPTKPAASKSKIAAATRPVKLRTIAISPAAKPARKKAKAPAPAAKHQRVRPRQRKRRISSRQ